MNIRRRGVGRREVIEAYATYDCAKKNRQTPDFGTWDWWDADAIDSEMCRAGLKCGVPAGFLSWDETAVTIDDLRRCAVHGAIFPDQPRPLGMVDGSELGGWRPDRATVWYEAICNGRVPGGPILLRPSVSNEGPARWYVEDGSGRAIAFVANNRLFGPSQIVATGYLGRSVDVGSSFMRQRFPELL